MKFVYIPEIDKNKISEIIDTTIKNAQKGKNSEEKIYVIFPRIKTLQELFEFFYNEGDLSKKTIYFDKDFKWGIENNAGERIDLSWLSSGEKNLLYILISILFSTTRGSIIVIDEPELSLNIAWQQQFAYAIKKLREGNEMFIPQIIGITHSPFIVSGDKNLIVTADIMEN